MLCAKFYALFAVDFVGIKKPIFLDNHNKITTRLRQNCQQIEFTICLDNRVLSVGKTLYFLSELFILLHQDYIKFAARLRQDCQKGFNDFIGVTTSRLGRVLSNL